MSEIRDAVYIQDSRKLSQIVLYAIEAIACDNNKKFLEYCKEQYQPPSRKTELKIPSITGELVFGVKHDFSRLWSVYKDGYNFLPYLTPEDRAFITERWEYHYEREMEHENSRNVKRILEELTTKNI